MRLMDEAPVLSITENLQSFPQHYFIYNHDLNSLQTVIAQIQVDNETLLFASEDNRGLYIQIGLIGVESYPLLRCGLQHKIVYGRKWRIDKDVPTPEIIQTAFLAVQKAKEHEVRELLTYRPKTKKSYSALFSCHQDTDILKSVFEQEHHHQVNHQGNCDSQHDIHAFIKDALSRTRLAGRNLKIEEVCTLTRQRLLVDLSFEQNEKVNDPLPPEFNKASFELIVDAARPSTFLYRLLDECVAKSYRYIAEHFTYKGFARFSEALSPDFISNVSLASRPYSKQKTNVEFSKIFKKENAQIDAARVPNMGVGELYTINLQKLSRYPSLQGFLPNGLLSQSPTYAKK
jgi:hypothetical protein